MADTETRASLRKASAALVVSALVFFPMILNPVIVGFFDTTVSETELLDFRESHWLAIRLLFTGVGVSFLILGIALAAWARGLRTMTSGGWLTVSDSARWLGVAGGVLSFLAYSSVWLSSASSYGDFSDSTGFTVMFAVGWVPLSCAFILLGVLLFHLREPRWLGVALPLFAVLPYVTGMLPLWFQVGALVSGITGVIRYRTGRRVEVAAPS